MICRLKQTWPRIFNTTAATRYLAIVGSTLARAQTVGGNTYPFKDGLAATLIFRVSDGGVYRSSSGELVKEDEATPVRQNRSIAVETMDLPVEQLRQSADST